MGKEKAIVLLSGGIDSATSAAIAKNRGFVISALTFNYGQKHAVEIESSKLLADFFDIKDHTIIDLPVKLFRSALIKDSGIDIPKNRNADLDDDIPNTYVPARNILFLSFALSFAESVNAGNIFIGANMVDYSGYPDCREEFFRSFNEMANIGTKAGVNGQGFVIETPLIRLTKSEIIKTGLELGVDYSLTVSCYDPEPNGSACGECDSCYFRKKGFKDAGVEDPTVYSC